MDGINARLSIAPEPLIYNETLIDETQRDEVDDVDEESIDPSGGFELEVVDSQLPNIPDPEPILELEPTNLRRSTRNQKVDKVPEEKWFTQPMTQDYDSLSCEDTPSQPLPLPLPSPLPLPLTSSSRKRSAEVASTLVGRKIRKTFDEGEFNGTVTKYLG